MTQMQRAGSRPTAVKAYSFLMLLGTVFMALLGWSASAYYVPALCLLLQAALLWSGRSYGLFRWILILNQSSALVLILVLWLGDGLGDRKLDVSGAMLLVNLLCGGPLMAVLGALILPTLRRGKGLFHWFNPRWA
jgi:hypothetical protein